MECYHCIIEKNSERDRLGFTQATKVARRRCRHPKLLLPSIIHSLHCLLAPEHQDSSSQSQMECPIRVRGRTNVPAMVVKPQSLKERTSYCAHTHQCRLIQAPGLWSCALTGLWTGGPIALSSNGHKTETQGCLHFTCQRMPF